eukprot:4390267-Karenia_brevis.AAC.1
MRYWHSIQHWAKALARTLRENSDRTLNHVLTYSFSPSVWKWPPIVIGLEDFASLQWGKNRRERQFLQHLHSIVPSILFGERVQRNFTMQFLELYHPNDFEARLRKALGPLF